MEQQTSRNNEIRQAIDAQFSGVVMDYNLQRRILQQARKEGEVIVKKKLSVGLVFALVIVLIAVTALAVALLTPRQIVEDYGIPIANQSEGDSYTAEETNILLELARENGIQFSENGMANINSFLSQGEGYYKQELLAELAMAEFGKDRFAWTLEQQKWFDDVCVATGIFDQPQMALPGERDITQEQAVQIAQDYIHTHYDPSADLNDTAVYQFGIQYINGMADGAYPGLYWTVYYESRSIDAGGYCIFLNSKGEVWNTWVSPAYTPGAPIFDVMQKFDETLPRNKWEWSQLELRTFQRAISQSKTLSTDPLQKVFLRITQTTYPDISPDAMSAEQAGAIAAKAVGLREDAYGDDPDFDGAVYIGDDPNPVWKVCIFHRKGKPDASGNVYDENARFFVEVDSITGEVKAVSDEYTGWYFEIVLQKVYDEVESTWEEAPSPYG